MELLDGVGTATTRQRVSSMWMRMRTCSATLKRELFLLSYTGIMSSRLALLWTILYACKTVSSSTPCEENPERCCTPPPFIEIGFHLQFINNNETIYLDQGIRLEYERNGDWQPLRYYTTSLLQARGSAVTLNEDKVSVTAQSITYTGELPLHEVNTLESVYYREYLNGSASFLSKLRLRWSQRYLSVAVEQDRASWVLDNVTVLQWSGECTKILFKEDFENFTCSSSEGAIIQNAIESCDKGLGGTMALYFNGYDGRIPRRYIVIKEISLHHECQNTSLQGASECPSGLQQENSTLFALCPKGYRLNPTFQQCEDIDECNVEIQPCKPLMECVNTLGSYNCVCSRGYGLDKDGINCTDIPTADKSQGNNLVVNCRRQNNCEGEISTMTVRECCLDLSVGMSFTLPSQDKCYTCIGNSVWPMYSINLLAM